ncbi:sulfotransferase family 2 domain-containing protein [uncultured Thiodictyon sp.]|uniref:sulfotransferase family 2 domain-containing protein n=1 Tax=uncultured Thiodictyon sp. TaxID=1846217 RepID=UPI0025EFA718|nr:sulfotransferase family 2 domain-containing protein [uncultured Thiodictyon sp.]
MLLSIKHRFLYVHIAKTGGTSVRAALERLRWTDPWYWSMYLCSRLSHLSGHRTGTKFPRHSKIVAAKELLPKEFFDQLFKFGFVRNPWDLQVSSFHHIRRERPQFLGGHTDFEGFLRWKLDPQRPYQYHVDTSIELQTDYLIDLHGNLVVDFIGRYERLHADFATACTRIGIPTPVLPHTRQATDRSKDYRGYYNSETADLVARHFQRDIEMLGYAFDPPAGEGPPT